MSWPASSLQRRFGPGSGRARLAAAFQERGQPTSRGDQDPRLHRRVGDTIADDGLGDTKSLARPGQVAATWPLPGRLGVGVLALGMRRPDLEATRGRLWSSSPWFATTITPG